MSYDSSDDEYDYYDQYDYEFNYKERHSQGLCPCGRNFSYIKNVECTNYQNYGYNCVGVRVEPNGKVLSAPFGFGKKQYEIGPDFGEHYARDHPEEFRGVVLNGIYNPQQYQEYYSDKDDGYDSM